MHSSFSPFFLPFIAVLCSFSVFLYLLRSRKLSLEIQVSYFFFVILVLVVVFLLEAFELGTIVDPFQPN